MAFVIPNPLPISCTDCHQPMRVEYQSANAWNDTVIVAAECLCGRIIGDICGPALHWHALSARPLVRADIVCDSAGDIGKEAAVVIGQARERIADMERRIAAATWANGGRKP